MTALRLASVLLLVTVTAAEAQQVTHPKASLADIPARQAFLAHATDPALRSDINSLHSCTSQSFVKPPTGPMEIPHHYLTGSNGPTNPAEHQAALLYNTLARRVDSGADEYLATGSHKESACALAQLDAWARANALTDYDPKAYSQSWYEAEWTLSSLGIADSVLVNDTTLDPAQQARVTAWLAAAAHKLISYETPGKLGNNHHYWRALAAISIGVVASDDELFQFGVNTYKESIAQLDANGAWPLEMVRHENAIHYQGFALAPIVLVAQFAYPQGVDLFTFEANGHTLRNAITFFASAVANPALVKPYIDDPQKTNFGPSDFAPITFYVAHFGLSGLPPNIAPELARPSFNTDVGGTPQLFAYK